MNEEQHEQFTMPTDAHPGVFVEEMPSGSMPLSTAATAVAAFVGFTEKGPADDRFDENVPRAVTDWAQYERLFGGLRDDALLPLAVKGFFENGGGKCYIVRIPDSERERRWVEGLAVAEDVTMICVPDLWTVARKNKIRMDDFAAGYDELVWRSVQHQVVEHCDEHRRMAILDTPPGLDVQQVADWRLDAGIDSEFAALYHPWLSVGTPPGPTGGTTAVVPPSGHVAGIWSRTDETRGVWKAPANEAVMGILDLHVQITEIEQDDLNEVGVNAIRSFGSRGPKVWGARTLSSDPSWKHINVRRLFNMIETSIEDGTNWVVFEPNEQQLWDRVTRSVSAFLLGLWRDGALFGATPDEAFFVRCDAETNPSESVDLGRLVVEVGGAPVSPGEFVIFRLSQKAIGADG